MLEYSFNTSVGSLQLCLARNLAELEERAELKELQVDKPKICIPEGASQTVKSQRQRILKVARVSTYHIGGTLKNINNSFLIR